MTTYCLIHHVPGHLPEVHLFQRENLDDITPQGIAEQLNFPAAPTSTSVTVGIVKNTKPVVLELDEATQIRRKLIALAASPDGDMRAVADTLRSYAEGADDKDLKATLGKSLEGLESAIEEIGLQLGLYVQFGTPHKKRKPDTR